VGGAENCDKIIIRPHVQRLSDIQITELPIERCKITEGDPDIGVKPIDEGLEDSKRPSEHIDRLTLFTKMTQDHTQIVHGPRRLSARLSISRTSNTQRFHVSRFGLEDFLLRLIGSPEVTQRSELSLMMQPLFATHL
jgi:hypothetical protein